MNHPRAGFGSGTLLEARLIRRISGQTLRRHGGMLAVDEIGWWFFGLAESGGEQKMIGGQRARRICTRGVAGQRQRLATATVPVDFAPLARPTGLWHPGCAAEALERRGMVPDFREAGFADSRKAQSRDGFRRMTWKHFPRRGDVQKAPTPAVHASLRAARVIVGHDVVYDETAAEPRARLRPWR